MLDSSSILVVSLATARRMAMLGHSYTHAVQILDSNEGDFPVLAPERNTLRLLFADTEIQDPNGPTEAHVAALLAFARSLPPSAKVVFHCQAGRSRSPAAALVVMTACNPAADPGQLARAVESRSRESSPNRTIVSLADHLLDRGGRLAQAALAWKQRAAAARDPLLNGGGWL